MNRFKSEDQCQKKCKCFYDVDQGTGNDGKTRYYFNEAKGQCEELLMVGMEGIPTTLRIWKLAPVLALVAKTRMLEQMVVPSH